MEGIVRVPEMTITEAYQATLLFLRDRHGLGWGITGGKYAGKSIVKFLIEHPEVQTILDYGCGSASLKEWVEERGITDRLWTLYDPGVPQYKQRPAGKFDLVITTDVLEHVEEIMLNNVLDHLHSLTGKFLYSEIACYFSGNAFEGGPYTGQDFHINMKAPDSWVKRLQHRDFTSIEYNPSILEGWKIRCLLLQERIHDE